MWRNKYHEFCSNCKVYQPIWSLILSLKLQGCKRKYFSQDMHLTSVSIPKSYPFIMAVGVVKVCKTPYQLVKRSYRRAVMKPNCYRHRCCWQTLRDDLLPCLTVSGGNSKERLSSSTRVVFERWGYVDWWIGFKSKTRICWNKELL
jgi:hypothetical protein